MKKWFLHILLLAGLFGVLTTSCSQEEGLEPQVPTEKIPVSFSIELDTPTARSRANNKWGDNYDNTTDNDYQSEIGDEFENHIDPELLYAELTLSNPAENESLTCGVENVTVFETDRINVYRFVGEVEVNEDITNLTTAKVNVYANFQTDKDGNILTFDTDYTGVLKGKGVNSIPMWGVKTNTNFSLTSGGIKDFGPIYLLRAMAKIEVTLDEDLVSEGYSLNNAYLGKYSANGNIHPTGFSRIANTLDIDTISSFNKFVAEENSASTVAQVGGLEFVQSGANRYIIYVPEHVYSNDDLILVRVKKKIEGTENEYKDILKKDNTFPSFTMNITNLVRNHLYRYNIIKINDGASLELSCQVQPWDVDEETIQFTDEVSISKKMTWTGSNITANTTDASILYINGSVDSNTAATVKFQIDTPVGATWYASFEGDKEAFAFLDSDGNEVTSVSGEVGELATLRVVTTEEHVSEMKSVSLKIVVRTMDGRTIMVNKELMPQSLTDKDFYQIRQNLTV